MKINTAPGKYILAVSGGVDSMTLLHLLAQKRQSPVTQKNNETIDYRLSTIDSTSSLELVVTHFNHGIRPESDKDEAFVKQKARQYGLVFESARGKLGQHASEEAARKARYVFLDKVQKKYRADGIITAHHQDDLIETAFLNLLRGTGSRGLTAIMTNKKITRPLLGQTKKEIIGFASKNKLDWREDPTNSSDLYLRNYLRRNITAKLNAAQRDLVICNIDKVAKNEILVQSYIANLSQIIYKDTKINRSSFTNLPIDLGNELVVYWLRGLDRLDFDKKTISRINLAIRTAKPGTVYPVKRNLNIEIGQTTAEFFTP